MPILFESGSAAFTMPSPTIGRVDVATARRLRGQIAEVVRRLLTSLAVEGGRCGWVLVGGMTAAAVLDRTGVSRLVRLSLCQAGFVTLCRVEPTTGPIELVTLKGGASGDEAVLGGAG